MDVLMPGSAPAKSPQREPSVIAIRFCGIRTVAKACR